MQEFSHGAISPRGSVTPPEMTGVSRSGMALTWFSAIDCGGAILNSLAVVVVTCRLTSDSGGARFELDCCAFALRCM